MRRYVLQRRHKDIKRRTQSSTNSASSRSVVRLNRVYLCARVLEIRTSRSRDKILKCHVLLPRRLYAGYPLYLVGRKEERRILFHEYYDPPGISVCEWLFRPSSSFCFVPFFLLFTPAITSPSSALRFGFSFIARRDFCKFPRSRAQRNEIFSLHPLCAQ